MLFSIYVKSLNQNLHLSLDFYILFKKIFYTKTTRASFHLYLDSPGHTSVYKYVKQVKIN